MNIFKIISLNLTLLIFTTLNSFSQKIKVESEQSIQIDHLENIYLINKGNLSILNNNKHKEYQNNFLGDIYSIDISNPLRILVFHKDANQIIFLNNELSIIGDAISLDEINLPDISTVCTSQINGFWVFNNLNNRIEFYNSNLIKIHTSIDLSNQINNLENIEEIKMAGEQIYLKVKNTGILVFDMFATYIKTLPIKETNSFQIFEQSIIYAKNQQILIYSFDKLNTSVLFQSDYKIDYAQIVNSHLYYLENDVFNKLSLTSLYK